MGSIVLIIIVIILVGIFSGGSSNSESSSNLKKPTEVNEDKEAEDFFKYYITMQAVQNNFHPEDKNNIFYDANRDPNQKQ